MLDVSPELLRLGLSTAVVTGRGVNHDEIPSALIDYRRKAGQQLAGQRKSYRGRIPVEANAFTNCWASRRSAGCQAA